MLYKMSMSGGDIPPLFVQLDKLDTDSNANQYWKERARWIRFEEIAENVLGRWSKPRVATIPQTALDELKRLLANGTMLFDMMLNDMKEIADVLANELLGYFNDLDEARMFAEILLLPHRHHHAKKQAKSLSGSNIVKMTGSSTLTDQRREASQLGLSEMASSTGLMTINERSALSSDHNSASSNNLNPAAKPIKYQYSFTDSIMIDDFSSQADFKENTKFKKKVHRQAEGASVQVMPLDFVQKSKIVFLRLQAAVDLPGLFEVKVRTRFVVLVIGPTEKKSHLYEVGRSIAACLADDLCRELFYSAQSTEDMLGLVEKFNRGTMVIPPGEWNPKIRIEPPEKYLSKEERQRATSLSEYLHLDEASMGGHDHTDPTLKGSRKPFAGIVNDVKRKLPFFLSDITDCLNLQCIATTLYMYLVSLCSLVAFGGMLGKKTDNLMATIECILAGSVCGVLFSLFSGQPLNIISATGPMLILESIINDLCKQNDIDFMEFRVWIGLWTALLLLLLVAFNLSFLVKYITRFTEDCFATLVAIIFIIDAIKSTVNLRRGGKKSSKAFAPLGGNDSFLADEYLNNITTTTPPPPDSYEALYYKYSQEAAFFFSVILFVLTFAVCMTLKSFRDKPFLPSKIRQVFSDFAVLIAIVIASAIDFSIGLQTQKLTIPTKFEPTTPSRGWVISPFGKNPVYTYFIAIVPAIIATILVFMDQQITAVIVNRKEFKLKKSSGYHLDLFIIAISIAICSLLGLPWFVAATVLALTHINSLKVMSENTAPGEKPVFIGVREQRMTTLIMSVLVGLSVFLTRVLSFIPMPVLYGVFMFMGVSALRGMQFFERILILFMPAKHQPDVPYLRHVSANRVHIFTIIQIISTAGLYLIKFIDSVAITFPILVLATCGIRKLLDFVFTQRELFWLDDILPGSGGKKKKGGKKKQDEEEDDDAFEDSHHQEQQRLNGAAYPTKSNLKTNKSFERENNLSSCNLSSNNSNYELYGQLISNAAAPFIDQTPVENKSILTSFEKANDTQNNNLNSPAKSTASSNNSLQPPVRFVTHFNNIKEDGSGK